LCRIRRIFSSIVLHWQCGTNACFFQFLRKCIFGIFFFDRLYWTRKVVLFLAMKKITKFLINVFLVLFFNFRKKSLPRKKLEVLCSTSVIQYQIFLVQSEELKLLIKLNNFSTFVSFDFTIFLVTFDSCY